MIVIKKELKISKFMEMTFYHHSFPTFNRESIGKFSVLNMINSTYESVSVFPADLVSK